MILCDVTVLVCAHKEGADRHDEYQVWLEDAMNGDEAFGVSDLVLSRVLRIVTHPRVFDPPSTWDRASKFADSVRSAPSAVPVAPGPCHWKIFTGLGGRAGVRGNLVPDAYLAALRSSPDRSGSLRIVASRAIEDCASGTRLSLRDVR